MKKTGIFLAVSVLLIGMCAVGIWLSNIRPGGMETESADELVVQTASGFYQREAEVQVTVPKGATVYYTTNCEEPTPESGSLYQGPFVLSAPEAGEQVYVLRFKACYKDGTWSETQTRTYFVGHAIDSRYSTKVISIVGDPDGLFGYENGIMVPGQAYDEFMEANPGIHPGGGVEANYTKRGDEAEREVYLEMFDSDGETIFSQNGGIRIAGAASRMCNHKSLRLYARKEYDEINNKFRFDFFEGLVSDENGTMGQAYKRLLLKNAGQDYGYAFLRSELVSSLADEAGFPDVQHVTPICVYINGEYYGSYWLSNHYDETYFANRYGEYDGEFVILERNDKAKETSVTSTETEISAVKEYNEQYNRFSAMDLTQEANYAALQEFMDVENYLMYFAIENYVGNYDWPENNVKTYRYLAGASGYKEGSVFDGRYRMLLYDVDYGFGLMYYYDTIGTLADDMTLEKVIEGGYSPMFSALMQREDCRKYFVSCTLDLMNGAMRSANVNERLDEMHVSHAEELSRTLAVEGLVGGLLLDPEQMNMDTVMRNLQQIRSFAEARPQYVLQDVENHFAYGQQYNLTVVSDEGSGQYSRAKVNSVYCEDERFVGTYLKEIPVTVSACIAPNETFSHWLVNGQRVEDEELVLEGEGVLSDSVEIVLVTKEAESPRLQIAAVATRGQADYVELTNLSNQQVSTSGYYLSDTEDQFRYALPVLSLAPGETIRLVGKDNNTAESLGQFGLNFNIKTGEVLTLSYLEDVVDSVEIVQLSEDGVYTRDFVRDIYTEQKRE